MSVQLLQRAEFAPNVKKSVFSTKKIIIIGPLIRQRRKKIVAFTADAIQNLEWSPKRNGFCIFWLQDVSWLFWAGLWVPPARVLSYPFVYTSPTLYLKGTLITFGTTRLALMDIVLGRCDRKICNVTPPSISIWIWRRRHAGAKHQPLDVYWKVVASGTANAPLEKELSVLVIESGDIVDDTVIFIFVLEAYKRAPWYIATNADGTDAIPRYLDGFITAQSAKKICRTVARQLGLAESEFVLNQESLVAQRAQIDKNLQKLMGQLWKKCLLKLWHHFLSPVTSNNVVCMNLCDGVTIFQTWTAMFVELWAGIAVVARIVRSWSTSTINCFSLQRNRKNSFPWISWDLFIGGRKTISMSWASQTDISCLVEESQQPNLSRLVSDP